MKIIITTLFGLESPTKEDLLGRGYDKDRITVNDGVVTLEGDFFDVARANMWVNTQSVYSLRPESSTAAVLMTPI